MDPNLNNFPLVSYVLARLPTIRRSSAGEESDIESPAPQTPSPSSLKPHFELAERMPHLTDPKIVSDMRSAVAEVVQARKLLKSLGERPDHETVDSARLLLAEIDGNLVGQLEDVALSSDQEDEAGEQKKELQRRREMCKAVLSLDEMHESYGKLLNEAEQRLEKIYEAAVSGVGSVDEKGKAVVVEEVDEVNEDVVAILMDVERGGVVESVNLSGKELRLLPEAFGKIKSLLMLDLSSNQLQALPDSIAGLENLEELNVSSNSLEALPDSIGLLFKLKILDVSGNKLTALPDSICHCRSMVKLNAGFNKLAYLPTNIGYELVNLTNLSVQFNRLRHLPKSIGEMNSLCQLDAHFNELHGLPATIGKLSSLEIVNLSGNFTDFSELPSTFGDLTNLKELDLSNNQIHALPGTFARLENIKKLNVDLNPLEVPPKVIVDEGIEVIMAYMREGLEAREAMVNTRLGITPVTPPTDAGYVERSSFWLKNVVTSFKESVSGYSNSPTTTPSPSGGDDLNTPR